MEGKSAFVRTICGDFKIGINYPFILAIFAVTLGFCFDNWQDLRISINNPAIYSHNSPICVVYYVFNAFSFGGVFTEYFSATMAALAFATNYCSELSGGMDIYKISRCGCRNYVRSKFFVVSVLGGLTMLLGGLVFMLLLSTYLPIVTPEKIFESQGFPFSRLLSIGNGIPYLAVVLYLSFLSGALWGSIGLWISVYFPSSYVAVCVPFIFRFLLVQIGRLLNLPNGMRLDLLLTARGAVYSDFVTILVVTAVVLTFIFLCDHLFMERMKRRIWDVE